MSKRSDFSSSTATPTEGDIIEQQEKILERIGFYMGKVDRLKMMMELLDRRRNRIIERRKRKLEEMGAVKKDGLD